MEELKTTGIIVGAEDYKESDRLVRILTPDLGVVRAVMRGVKKEKAKLKFASTPFAFCEYELIKRGAFYTVKTASSVESLFGVTSTPERYVAASVLLETAAEASGNGDAELFVSLLTALKDLIYSGADAYGIAYRFVRGLLASGGYSAEECADGVCAVPAAELRRCVRSFENKFICRIRSAALL